MKIKCIFIILHYLRTTSAIEIQAGKPLPHAEDIHKILTKYVFNNTSEFDDGSVFDYLFGNGTTFNVYSEDSPTHIDVNVLDFDNLQKAIDLARKRIDTFDDSKTRRAQSSELFYYVPVFIRKSMDLMKQSIYLTRERLQQTRSYREKYKTNYSYNIAVLYGTMLQLKIKMENMYATMNKLTYKKTAFYWYLILYEKILAAHVDVTFIVQRIFDLNNKFVESFKQKAMEEESPEVIDINEESTTKKSKKSKTQTKP